MTYVKVKFQMEGIHAWSEAIENVSFLKHPHRHMFHISASKLVSHGDREVEIIMLKRAMQAFLAEKYFDVGSGCLQFGNMSCEHIAEQLVEVFGLASCEVLEDGENGAGVISTNNPIIHTNKENTSCEDVRNIKHYFIAGVYARQMNLPKGYFVNSHKHKFNHMSILAQGRVIVTVAGTSQEFIAPAVLNIEANTVHRIEALEDSMWYCIHATEETDVKNIDEVLISKETK